MAYLYLMLSILAEVAGTTCFRLSEGFAIIRWGVIAIALYGLSLSLLAQAMHKIPMSVSYPLWAGVGTALTVVVGMSFFDERLSLGQWFGLALAIGGAILLRVSSPAEVSP